MTKKDELTEPQSALLAELAESHPGQRVPVDVRVANNLVDKGLAEVGSQPDAYLITKKGLAIVEKV